MHANDVTASFYFSIETVRDVDFLSNAGCLRQVKSSTTPTEFLFQQYVAPLSILCSVPFYLEELILILWIGSFGPPGYAERPPYTSQ